MSSSSSPFFCGERRHWWFIGRKIAEKYVKDARVLIATREESEIAAAINLLDAALAVSPRLEAALELKARSLLLLRRFKEVADMLQDFIPSYKMAVEDSSSSFSSDISASSSQNSFSREKAKLLPDGDPSHGNPSCRCFSVSDLKKKVMASLNRSCCEKEGQWRYLILGQACCHLGLMEDAMVLLQTGKRLASAAFRRESVCWSEDSFSYSNASITGEIRSSNAVASTSSPSATSRTKTSAQPESIANLLANIKLLLRRRAAGLAALDAGLPSEAIRHLSKIVDSRRGGAPLGFLSECFVHRAAAYRAAGRLAEAIADCNRTLALDPSCIPALSSRASLFESIRSYSDCLRDLEHLKLLYDTILRERKLPGPAWMQRHGVRWCDVPCSLRALAGKIQEARQRIASGEAPCIDYHALIGLRRGCTRSELERAHLLLCLRHRPDRATGFLERCDFAEGRDADAAKDQARMSALLLYRLLQKGYSSIMASIMDEEAAEQQKAASAATAAAAVAAIQAAAVSSVAVATDDSSSKAELKGGEVKEKDWSGSRNAATAANHRLELAESKANVYQGVFCRDIAVVGTLLSQVGFNRPIPVKYEALSC